MQTLEEIIEWIHQVPKTVPNALLLMDHAQRTTLTIEVSPLTSTVVKSFFPVMTIHANHVLFNTHLWQQEIRRSDFDVVIIVWIAIASSMKKFLICCGLIRTMTITAAQM